MKMHGTKERKLVPACSSHWKRLKDVIHTLVYFKLPKDVIDLIVIKVIT